jgi:glutaredoxin
MDKLLVIFTMKGCPYCEQMKEQLIESNLEFIERDIHEHEEEYDLFVEITENDYVPSFMIIESPDDSPKTHLFAPERDFNEINEGVEIIKEQFGKII